MRVAWLFISVSILNLFQCVVYMKHMKKKHTLTQICGWIKKDFMDPLSGSWGPLHVFEPSLNQ